MFQRLLTLYHRFVGSRPPARDDHDDRRTFVRFPSVARTRVRPMDNGQSDRLSVRVRNVSRGGINLVANHAFSAGEMISVEIPHEADDETETVLACVVHANPLPDGYWSLGCAFSEMLDEDKLDVLVSRREKPSRSEKREWARVPWRTKASFHLIADPEKRSRTASVVDISLGGIGLEVQEDVETGALVNLLLENSAGQSRNLLACVVHVVSDSGGRVLGCNFINELSEADLRALV